jgi:hypothetical protein
MPISLQKRKHVYGYMVKSIKIIWHEYRVTYYCSNVISHLFSVAVVVREVRRKIATGRKYE